MYAVITSIQSFRHRYVVKMEDGDTDPNPYKDYVTVGEVPEEFSQYHLGETVTDAYATDSLEQLVDQFDSDHIDSESEIFLGWTKDVKLQNVYYPKLKDDLTYYINFLDEDVNKVSNAVLIRDFKKLNKEYKDLSNIVLERFFNSL